MNSSTRFIEYKMPKDFMDMLLKSRKGNEKKMSNQKYLCKYVRFAWNSNKSNRRIINYALREL